jgi:hypothetical protein
LAATTPCLRTPLPLRLLALPSGFIICNSLGLFHASLRRYVNDMLAWVHQALASEREFVTVLFGGDDAPPAHVAASAPVAAGGDGAVAGGETLDTAALLDAIFESICRPLKVRVEQVRGLCRMPCSPCG